MDKRERVALAIAESDGHDWDVCTESQRGEYRDNADAAIAALEIVTVLEAREAALREAEKNLMLYSPTFVDGPEHDVGYYYGYHTAMNRIIDMIEKGDLRKTKKPNLVGTGVQMGLLKKNPGS